MRGPVHQTLPLTGHCPGKTHSATQPPAPEHPPRGQPSPTTPADYIGTGENHTSWKIRHRSKPQQMDEQTQVQTTPVGRKDE